MPSDLSLSKVLKPRAGWYRGDFHTHTKFSDGFHSPVVPIIAKPCAWESVGWLAEMQVRPKGGQPIWSKDTDIDTELSKIAAEVTNIVKNRWFSKPT